MALKMRRTSPGRRRSAGFSLVELMVASTLGLIVALAVVATMLTAGRQFSVTASVVSAQSSAQVALSLLEAAGRTAGAGFFNNGQPVCASWHAWNGTTLVSNGDRLMPARIVAGGGAGASDTVVFTGGGGNKPLTGAPVLENAANGVSIKVSDGGNWADGDLAVLGVPGLGQPCTLFQVTGAPAVTSACHGNATSCRLLVRNPNQGLNPNPTTFTGAPVFGFTTAGSAVGPAVVSRVGTAASGMRQDAFAIQCNALVRYNAFTTAALPACTETPMSFGAGVDALATDVVLMHAQYGVTASAASDVVTSWEEAARPQRPTSPASRRSAWWWWCEPARRTRAR